MAKGNGNVGTVFKSSSSTTSPVTTAWDSGTGSNRILMVTIVYEDGGDATPANRKRVSGVTYGGASGSLVGATYQAANASRDQVELWSVSAPLTGMNDLVVSFTNPAEDSMVIIAAKVYTGVSAVAAVAQNILATNSAAETVTSTKLTFTAATSRAHISLGLATAGMSPIDSVSGWTVDHEDEQGTADGGNAVATGWYDTDAAAEKTFTWSPGASTSGSRYWGYVAAELIEFVSNTISLGAPSYAASDTLNGTVLIEVNRSGDFPSAPTATLAGVALTRDSFSGPTAYFRMPLTSLFNNGGSFAAIEWYTNQTLAVTDSSGTMNATMQITAPVFDHYDILAGGAFDYPATSPAAAANGDTCYVDILSGNGEGLPALAGFQGNTVPTTVAFRFWDDSGNVWLTAVEHTFDVAAAASDGELYDAFTDTNGVDIDAHTPNTRILTRMWVIDRDVSTAAVPTANSVEIQSNQLKMTAANAGAEYDTGDTDFDITVYWTPTGDDNGFAIHGRRLDDAHHIHAFIREDGTLSINQRVNSVNVGLEGTTTFAFGVFPPTVVAITFRGTGAQIELLINDVIVCSATSSVAVDSSATKIGVFAGGASRITNGVRLDSINAYSGFDSAVRTLVFGPVVTF